MIPRSWLYCPGNNSGQMVNVHVYGADGIVLDLEDAVAPADKLDARFLVAGALAEYFPKVLDRRKTPSICVRINGIETAWWRDDLEAVLSAGGRIIRVPKVESPDQIQELHEVLQKWENAGGEPVTIQCILETPIGVERAVAIAEASFRIESLVFGAEDYCAATGIDRTGPEWALDYPRSRIVLAAATKGLPAYDTVWSDFRDQDGLFEDARRSRALGMAGKSAIHPDQVDTINHIFTPTEAQRAWAQRIIDSVSQGNDQTSRGVGAVEGQMVDAPVLRRAKGILFGRSE